MPPPPPSFVSASSVSCPRNRWSPLLPSRIPNSWVQSVAYPLRLRRSSESPLHPSHAPAVSVVCIHCMMTRIRWPASGTHSLLVPTVPVACTRRMSIRCLSHPSRGPNLGVNRSVQARGRRFDHCQGPVVRSGIDRSVRCRSFDQEPVVGSGICRSIRGQSLDWGLVRRSDPSLSVACPHSISFCRSSLAAFQAASVT